MNVQMNKILHKYLLSIEFTDQKWQWKMIGLIPVCIWEEFSSYVLSQNNCLADVGNNPGEVARDYFGDWRQYLII